MVSGREALQSASGVHSALSTSYYHKLLEKPMRELPFGELMDNFKETFEKVFVEEKPISTEKYYLSGITLMQVANKRNYDTLFSFAFTQDTTKEVEYGSSPLTSKLLKKIVKHIGKLENFQTDNKGDDNGPSVKIQMYEFFFSHILIKAMQVPFLEHTYMLGFFERNIRKRVTEDKKNRSKRKSYRRRENEEFRRDRTMKLRQFYEFFSLLFDQKLFTPFSQFLSDEALKDLQDILKKRIKQKAGHGKKDDSMIGKIEHLIP